MRNVLIVSYYWPPAGGPGSQRNVKFAKYLSYFGWRVQVLTVMEGEFPYFDHTLQEDLPSFIEIWRTPNLEPFNIYKKFTGKKKDTPLPVGLLTIQKKSLTEKIAAKIRTNLFVPDARIGWLPFAIPYCLKIIGQKKIDLIFTSSPPHSSQLIGYFLKKKTNLPWVADLRDPWTGIRYYQFTRRSRITQRMDAFCERQVLRYADHIITVSNALSSDFMHKLLFPSPHKFTIIPNGYDPQDFDAVSPMQTRFFEIIHAGNFLAHQNPIALWKALQRLLNENVDFKKFLKIRLIGRVHGEIIQSIKKYNLQQYAEVKGFVPHRQILNNIKSAAVLLMVVPQISGNKGIVTGKLFEYIGSGKPILVIGPSTGDAAKIISSFSQSIICDYEDSDSCFSFIQRMYNLWNKKKLPESEINLREQFSRKNLTEKLAEVFNRVLREYGR